MANRLEYHPAANLLPKMTEEELDGLAKDIAAHGQQMPIVLHKAQILDGRHRYEACAIAGVDPHFVEWDGHAVMNRQRIRCSPTIYVLSLNAHRRHLTASQKAMVAAEAMPLLEAEARERKSAAASASNARRAAEPKPGVGTIAHSGNEPEAEPLRARDDAVRAVGGGVSGRYVQEAKSLKEEHPQLAEEVKAGVKTLPEAKREINKRKIKAQAAEVKAAAPKGARVFATMQELTWAVSGGDEKPFGCIYADPPWKYENQGTRGATDNEYVTLEIADIQAMPIADIAAKDSTLFLWATSTLLPEAFATLAAWGFSYRCTFVWDKSPAFGLGNRFRICTEFMLVGVRGNPAWIPNDVPNIYRGDAGKHSAKPAAIRDLIGRCVVGPFVELFAREPSQGWACMGNEVVAAVGKESA